MQINFTANLDGTGYATMFFIIKGAKETVLDFLQGIVKDLKIKNTRSLNNLVLSISNLQLIKY